MGPLGIEPRYLRFMRPVPSPTWLKALNVPLTGLEPVRPKPGDFKSPVSTYSTTMAQEE